MKFVGLKQESRAIKYAFDLYRDLRYADSNYLSLLRKLRKSNLRVQNILNSELNWNQYYEENLAKYKNLHKGEDCFIIGNGPSLNKIDLSLLNKHHTIGLNKIFLIFKRIQLDLSYHVSVNDLVVEQSIEEFKKLRCPSFLSLRKSEIPESEKNINYIKTVGGCDGFNTDLIDPLVENGTVTCVAMQIAYYLGFKNIFLVGVDHSFAQKGKPNSTQLLNEDDSNHFDPNYFKGQKWNLADLESSEKGYRFAKVYFENDNRKIYDATVDGNLEVFPKISFEKAIKMCSLKE